jgi:hypothetical protein
MTGHSKFPKRTSSWPCPAGWSFFVQGLGKERRGDLFTYSMIMAAAFFFLGLIIGRRFVISE